MEQDTLIYDSLATRPLPKWLTDQRDGLNTIQPAMMEMKVDNSLIISFAITGGLILLVVTVLTIHIFRKRKKHSI